VRGGWRFPGHLGTSVSALVDGQLDEGTSERAWAHVMHCVPCRQAVEREGWVKRQLASMAADSGSTPPPELVGSLHELAPMAEAWAAVEEIERRGRGRRVVGIALVGAGSVSVAVFGLTALGGPSGGGAGSPAATLTRSTSPATPIRVTVAPTGTVSGVLTGWTVQHRSQGGFRATALADRP
jgi:hypothetical protein